MGYYRGDYYRGDYYRGDLGGFLKKAAKVVGAGVGGFITGGPVAAGAAALAAIRKPATNAAVIANTVGTMGIGSVIKGAGKLIGPVLAGKEVYDLTNGFGLFGGRGNGKRRTMNHLNPKALSRATRRVEGFIKKARKAVSPLGYTVARRASGRCAPKRKCR